VLAVLSNRYSNISKLGDRLINICENVSINDNHIFGVASNDHGLSTANFPSLDRLHSVRIINFGRSKVQTVSCVHWAKDMVNLSGIELENMHYFGRCVPYKIQAGRTW
jgi:hypothetical protein